MSDEVTVGIESRGVSVRVSLCRWREKRALKSKQKERQGWEWDEVDQIAVKIGRRWQKTTKTRIPR